MHISKSLTFAALGAAFLSTPAIAAEKVSITLDWTPNTNFVGLYVAQSLGLYEAAGLDVEILPFEFGQPSGDVAAFGVLDFYAAKARGEDATGIYAVIQHETGRLAYIGDNIKSPRDLADGRYGGFGSTWEKAIVDTMIANDGGAPAYERATLDGSVYDALRAGEIDFTLEVLTWQGVENALAGYPVKAFRYADYGIPDQHTIMLAADAAFLDQRPEAANAFTKATRDGFAYAIANPEEASAILVAAAPELTDKAELVEASMQVMIDGHYLMRADGTIGRFDDQLMTELGDFLFDAGALVGPDGKPLAEKPDVSTWYSNRFLD